MEFVWPLFVIVLSANVMAFQLHSQTILQDSCVCVCVYVCVCVCELKVVDPQTATTATVVYDTM